MSRFAKQSPLSLRDCAAPRSAFRNTELRSRADRILAVMKCSRGAKMRKAGDPAILLFGLAARLVWRSRRFPPHGGEAFPSAGLERLLRHPIARVGAAAALAAVTEVRIPIFLVEVRIENIELDVAGMVLANPEIPVRLDIEEELAGQTPPVVGLAFVVVLAAFRINAWVDQRRRFHASKEFRIYFLLRRDTKFPFADDNGVQPKPGISEFPGAIVDDVFHLIAWMTRAMSLVLLDSSH